MKFQAHSPTSSEAAHFAEGFAGTAREQVFLQIVKRFADIGATDEEIQNTLHMNPSTQRPRRIELVEAGLVEDSCYTRPTTSGMDAVAVLHAARNLAENPTSNLLLMKLKQAAQLLRMK